MRIRPFATVAAIYLATCWTAWGQVSGLPVQASTDLPESLDVTAFAARSRSSVVSKACALPSGIGKDGSTNRGSTENDISEVVEISLSGRQIGTSLALELRTGSDIQSVRVFSEPSHTLLGVIIDTHATAAESATWLSAGGSSVPASRIVRSDLSKGSITLFDGPVQPPGDTQIHTYLRAFFPVKTAGTESQEHVIRGTLPANNFEFSYKDFRTADGDIDPTVCCGGSSNCHGQVCYTCDPADFICCGWTSGSCEQCNDLYLCCGRGFCDPC